MQPTARSFISLGAIIVILSITMDPFVQLTVGKKEVLKFEDNSNVQIPYATRYSKQLKSNGTLGAEAPMADLGMQSAVLDGFFQSDPWISQQTPRSCPSGDCIWDTFTSLAICSGCNDLRNRVQKYEGTYIEKGRSFPYERHFLPNNVSPITDLTLMTARGTSNTTDTLSFTSLDTLIWSMTMMKFPWKDGYLKGEIDDDDTPSAAIECALWYCVNSYKSAVNNGSFTEIIQPAFSKREINSWQPFRISWIDQGVEVTPEMTGDPWTNSSQYRMFPRRTDLQLGAGFNVSQGAVFSIEFLMQNTFTMRNHDPGIPKNTFPFNDGVNAAAARPLYSSGPNYYDPPAMQILYESQDLAATFATLAKSMTNCIRQNSDNNTVINGKEGKYLVLFRIRG